MDKHQDISSEENNLKNMINSSMIQVLERMKAVKPDDRYHLFMEHCEHLVSEVSNDDVLFFTQAE